jgi:hypothetical protein
MLWAIYQRAQSAFKALNNRSVNRELFARYQVTFSNVLGRDRRRGDHVRRPDCVDTGAIYPSSHHE